MSLWTLRNSTEDPKRLGIIIKRMASAIRKPRKDDVAEVAAARVLDAHFLAGWAWLLGDALRSGVRVKLEADIRSGLIHAYKEGYRRGRKRRKKRRKT
jgi:hypothetical protein